jgi:hypothetical protein
MTHTTCIHPPLIPLLYALKQRRLATCECFYKVLGTLYLYILEQAGMQHLSLLSAPLGAISVWMYVHIDVWLHV